MMNTHRFFAKLTGYSLFLMAAVAGFSLGFAFTKLYNQDHPDVAQGNIAENPMLYRFMLAGLSIVLLLDLLVSLTLYEFFKNDNRKLSLLSGILRVIYSAIFGIAIYHLALNMGETQKIRIIENYDWFQTIWSMGLVAFGFHLLAVGVLMKAHQLIPGFLWCLTLIAGVSYVGIHFLKAAIPQQVELTDTINSIMGFPMALAELGLALWMVIKGGKRLNNQV
jgi:Domain of unknown function (DUF4386)